MRRFGRFLALGSVVLLVLPTLLSGCQSAPAPLQLDAKDSGSQQTLSVGQRLEIKLDSNPTTGYQWAVDGALPPQLEQAGEPQHNSSSTALGAGGIDTWAFAGKSAGTGKLKLKYWRSFEPTVAPVNTFEVSVTVR